MAQAVEERKLATVLFSDLVGSTELGDRRTRSLLVRELLDRLSDEEPGTLSRRGS